MHMHMHLHLHMHMHLHIYAYTCAHTSTRTHTHTHTHTHTQTHTHAHAHTRAHTHTRTHTYILYIRIYSYIYAHIHIHIHVHVHLNIHVRIPLESPPICVAWSSSKMALFSSECHSNLCTARCRRTPPPEPLTQHITMIFPIAHHTPLAPCGGIVFVFMPCVNLSAMIVFVGGPVATCRRHKRCWSRTSSTRLA